MLKRLTVYEIRAAIKRNFQSMCSDSLGSIQAAIKKLLVAEMITYTEYVEKSVNKKQYSITDKGRSEFMAWLHMPADVSRPKNIEFGKLLFMGLLPAEQHLPMLEEAIGLLEKDLAAMLELQASIPEYRAKEQAMAYMKSDHEYCSGIQEATQNSDMAENIESISFFQVMALQYGIDGTRFQIEWLRGMLNKIKGEKT